MIRHCKKHGDTPHFVRKDKGAYRCNKCAVVAVVAARVRKKLFLVSELGGKCEVCGYAKSVWALDFHHKDPSTKLFGVSSGMNRSYAVLLEEARKCHLLCKNCHAEHHEAEGHHNAGNRTGSWDVS